MSRHEKNVRAGARLEHEDQVEGADRDTLDELEGSEELLKTSFTAGNEMKIALAVILVLVVIFAAAVVKWMRQSPKVASQPAQDKIANSTDRGPLAGDKEKPDRSESSPFGLAGKSSKTTVVAAVPGASPEVKPKSRANEPDSWAFASDSKPRPTKTHEERPSASSSGFKPRIGSGEPAGRVGDSPGPGTSRMSLGGWENDTQARTPAASQAPSDPFRTRPPVDGLRRDNTGMTAAVPPTPSASSADTAGRMPRFGELASPSAGSRAPRSSADPNLLRSPSFGGQVPASPPPAPARRDSVESRPRSVSTPTGLGGGRVYVAQAGDTIYDIARQQLGKAARWREIYELNKDVLGRESLDLAPGTRILLPEGGPSAVSRRNGSELR